MINVESSASSWPVLPHLTAQKQIKEYRGGIKYLKNIYLALNNF